MPRAGAIPHAAVSGICSWAAQGMPPSEPKQCDTTAVNASSVTPDLQGIELRGEEIASARQRFTPLSNFGFLRE
jgi:hypothetical protein